MRIRHKPNAIIRLKEHEDIVVFKPQLYKGRWYEFFNNNNPIYVEFGMGRGKFITTHASNTPNINYIGFEKKNEVIFTALTRVLENKITNIALVSFNIIYIEEAFSQNEIDTIFINFCDPWPKDRHAKRRLTHRLFLNKYKQLLKQNGEIIFKTDNKDLFDFSITEFKECGFELYDVTYDLKNENDPSNIPTEYETKFMEMGIRINRLKAKLKG